jgi:AcrR family transcriptional regulator
MSDTPPTTTAGDAARRPGRPRDPALDALVLRTSQEMLAERGLRELTVDAVAQRAAVGKATIYRRWPSREALVIATIRAMSEATEMPQTGDALADLRGYLTGLAERMRDPLTRRLHADILYTLAHNESFARDYGEMVGARFGLLRALVAEAAGIPDRDAPAVEAMLDMILGPFTLRQLYRPETLVGDQLDALIDESLGLVTRHRDANEHPA